MHIYKSQSQFIAIIFIQLHNGGTEHKLNFAPNLKFVLMGCCLKLEFWLAQPGLN